MKLGKYNSEKSGKSVIKQETSKQKSEIEQDILTVIEKNGAKGKNYRRKVPKALQFSPPLKTQRRREGIVAPLSNLV